MWIYIYTYILIILTGVSINHPFSPATVVQPTMLHSTTVSPPASFSRPWGVAGALCGSSASRPGVLGWVNLLVLNSRDASGLKLLKPFPSVPRDKSKSVWRWDFAFSRKDVHQGFATEAFAPDEENDIPKDDLIVTISDSLKPSSCRMCLVESIPMFWSVATTSFLTFFKYGFYMTLG